MAESWTHNQRWEMQEIVPGIFLGPQSCATSRAQSLLEANGITHMVCVRTQREEHFVREHFPDQICYHTITLRTGDVDNVLVHLPALVQFIDTALAQGGRVLIYDMVCISLAPTFMCGYLMKSRSMSFSDALTLIRDRRYCCCPTDLFDHQLQQFEHILSAGRINFESDKKGDCQKRRICLSDSDEEDESGMHAVDDDSVDDTAMDQDEARRSEAVTRAAQGRSHTRGRFVPSS